MIDTTNTQTLVAAAGTVLSGEPRLTGKGVRSARSGIVSIFGMYRDPRRQAALA